MFFKRVLGYVIFRSMSVETRRKLQTKERAKKNKAKKRRQDRELANRNDIAAAVIEEVDELIDEKIGAKFEAQGDDLQALAKSVFDEGSKYLEEVLEEVRGLGLHCMSSHSSYLTLSPRPSTPPPPSLPTPHTQTHTNNPQGRGEEREGHRKGARTYGSALGADLQHAAEDRGGSQAHRGT